MMLSGRHMLALVVNVALPVAAYRLALMGGCGKTAALFASAVPLVAWIGIDLFRYRHFDALSALALASIVLSLLVMILAPERWLIATQDPLISGFMGVLFLLSLRLHRPLAFYLARSTMAREAPAKAYEFDALWQSRASVVDAVRLMTAVWGIGLVSENAVRFWLTYHASGEQADRLSTYIRYTVYSILSAWTIYYRHRYIRRQQTSDA